VIELDNILATVTSILGAWLVLETIRTKKAERRRLDLETKKLEPKRQPRRRRRRR
jgi:hypothetical protein